MSGQACSLLNGTTTDGLACSAHAVHILLVVVGGVIVDDQHKLLHIQTACGNAGGDKQVAHIRFEVVDGRLAVALVLSAMQ